MLLPFLKEVYTLIKTILDWLCVFIGFTIILFVFGLQKVKVFDHSYVVPVPSERSFAVQIFNKIRVDLVSENVQLIVTNPMSAFLCQAEIALLFGFLFTLPFFLYKIILYLNPALLPRERRLVMWSVIPSVTLFFLGALFAYLFLIPATFDILYPYATNMGIVSFFSLDEFVYYVLLLVLASGVMFLLPIFMILLSFMGVVPNSFWSSKWRPALVCFLVLSAIITPDQTGITMLMLFLPLAFLYFVGCFFAKKLHGRV